jgi:hypothetical protein
MDNSLSGQLEQRGARAYPGFDLGDGINMSSNTPRPGAFDDAKLASIKPDNAVLATDIQSGFSDDLSQASSFEGQSVSLSAHYGFATGNFEMAASFSRTEAHNRLQNRIVFTVAAWQLMSPRKIKHPQDVMSAEAMKLYATQKDFTALYGSHFISEEYRGAVLKIEFTIENSSNFTRQQIERSLSMSFSAGTGGGGLNATDSSSFESFARSTNVTAKLTKFGGSTDSADLAFFDLSSSENAVSKMMIAAADAWRDVKAHPIVVGYATLPYYQGLPTIPPVLDSMLATWWNNYGLNEENSQLVAEMLQIATLSRDEREMLATLQKAYQYKSLWISTIGGQLATLDHVQLLPEERAKFDPMQKFDLSSQPGQISDLALRITDLFGAGNDIDDLSACSKFSDLLDRHPRFVVVTIESIHAGNMSGVGGKININVDGTTAYSYEFAPSPVASVNMAVHRSYNVVLAPNWQIVSCSMDLDIDGRTHIDHAENDIWPQNRLSPLDFPDSIKLKQSFELGSLQLEGQRALAVTIQYSVPKIPRFQFLNVKFQPAKS